MRRAIHWLQAAALRLLLTLLRPLPLTQRRAVIGGIAEWLVRLTPLRRRIEGNLDLVWPDLPQADRNSLIARAACNAGRTLTSIWYPADHGQEVANLPIEGPGLDALRAAHASGRGAVLISGHFGQWEAVRHTLRREGMEIGAIYRPNNNPWYDPLFKGGLEGAGKPVFPKGMEHYRGLVRFLRDGGMLAILPDQFVADGAALPFLGHPAHTSLAPADLALRHGIPLVPCFAPVEDGRIRVVLEAPIPHTTPETMMSAFNDRLSHWVTRHPAQWYWLHRRWKRPAPPSHDSA